MDSSSLTALLKSNASNFRARFETSFDLARDFDSSEIAFAESTLSNMLGGIGYFYGTSIVDRHFKYPWDRESDEDEEETKPHPELVPAQGLLTATPCRSFFPRGFYWDEGFHLLLINRWDLNLGLRIISSWTDLIDRDGWVGREQILGEEARSRVSRILASLSVKHNVQNFFFFCFRYRLCLIRFLPSLWLSYLRMRIRLRS